jgi:hypothetical protein
MKELILLYNFDWTENVRSFIKIFCLSHYRVNVFTILSITTMSKAIRNATLSITALVTVVLSVVYAECRK